MEMSRREREIVLFFFEGVEFRNEGLVEINEIIEKLIIYLLRERKGGIIER